MFSLNELLVWRANLHPDAAALIDDRGDRVSYHQLIEATEDCAMRWYGRGVRPGDVVAVLDSNSVAYLVQLFGLAGLGAVPAMFNWRLTAAENRALLDLIDPVAVAASPRLIDRLPEDLPDVRVALEAATDRPPLPAGWQPDRITAAVPQDPHGPPPQLRSPPPADGVFALGFSSGTTGRPKAIPLRHDSLVRSVLVDSADVAGMSPGSRQLMVAPTFHLAGLVNTLMGLGRGAEIHLRAGFDPASVLSDIDELGIAYMTAVPAMFRALVQVWASLGATDRPDTSTMLEMTYGASPISPELVRQIQEVFPGCRLRQFYGMTEIAGALTTLTPEDHDPARGHNLTCGQVNPGFEVRLVDPDGRDVADGLPGQILIRGPSVMRGYWRDPEATARSMTDGWFASGDIAIRQDGYLTVMDRSKDMIVTGGENVYPAEVEAVLYEYPGVIDVAVFGVPDERYGERVHAVIVADPGTAPTLESAREFCRSRLAGFKHPRSLEVADRLPRNATGKLLKRELRAPYWENRSGTI